ncbi:MAG TPA: BatD family protein [Gammaproteobacteria bacterium]|nr:BatD family protein [Gammaproteobacteria bacterium]
MVRGRVLRRLLAAAALACATLAGAQAPGLTASVDRPVVRDGESFTYSMRADGAVRGEPDETPLTQQFDVLQRSSSSRVQILNGQTSQVTEWLFQLMPKSTGEFTIPPLRVGDRQSNAVTVRVLPPDPAAAAAADIFMELDAQPKTAYVQSQVLFTLRLFIGVSTGRATLTPPEVTGGEAIVERLGEDSQYQTMRGGRTFIVRERRFAVFPQAAGKLTLGPATFEAMVIPDRGFSRVQRFRSGQVEIDVQPAVAPPPEFPGAAWLPAQHVTLSEEWSDSAPEVAVGVPRTRKIVVEGLGLLETQLPDVTVAQQTGIRQYADQPELSHEVTADGLKSRRSVSFAVIAQQPGEVTLAGVQVPWWNVTAQRWEVAELPPRTLTVTPSTEPAPTQDVAAPATTAETPAAPARNWWPIASAVLALAWLVTMALWWRSRGAAVSKPDVRGAPAGEGRPPVAPVRKILRDLDSACAVGDADAARRALLAYAEARFGADAPRSLGALAAVLPAAVGREVLALEAAIYGSTPGTWQGDGFKAVLPQLERLDREGRQAKDEPLLPLYR